MYKRQKLDKVEAKRAAQKPPGLAKKAVRGARTEAWFYLHNKIHEVEHENVGVEGAHKSAWTQIIAAGAPHGNFGSDSDVFCKLVPFWQLELYRCV